MAGNLDRFVNYGFVSLGNAEEACRSDKKTFIIVGVARGGTSLLSGTLNALGVFTGDKSVSPVYEDVRLAKYIDSKDNDGAYNVIHEYNKRYDIWAFKRPSIIHSLDLFHDSWRNPIYLFIFKDFLSIANRNVLSMGMDFLQCLNLAYNDYGNIIKFILQNKISGFCFSYDKILSNKRKFIDYLVEKLNIDAERENIYNATLFIDRDSEEYLDKTRIVE